MLRTLAFEQIQFSHCLPNGIDIHTACSARQSGSFYVSNAGIPIEMRHKSPLKHDCFEFGRI